MFCAMITFEGQDSSGAVVTISASRTNGAWRLSGPGRSLSVNGEEVGLAELSRRAEQLFQLSAVALKQVR